MLNVSGNVLVYNEAFIALHLLTNESCGHAFRKRYKIGEYDERCIEMRGASK